MPQDKHRTMIGGQAVIEGVMMRGVKKAALAVRTPDKTIQTEVWNVKSAGSKFRILRVPFIRGSVNFVEMIIFGYKTMMRSAEIAGLDDDEDAKKKEADGAQPEEKKKGAEWLMGLIMNASVVLGVLIAILLFVVAPAYFTSLLPVNKYAKTVVEGLIRITLFVIYLAAISLMKDIQRVYQYHGAEHKTIFCYENGEELTPENARKFKRFHPRCGTSFLLIVLVIGILVFSFVTWKNVAVRILLHLLLLPVVVGISYEIIKFAGRHDNSVMRFLLAPGLWLQRLTTREPDDSQLEVAIESLKAVLTGNPDDDKW